MNIDKPEITQGLLDAFLALVKEHGYNMPGDYICVIRATVDPTGKPGEYTWYPTYDWFFRPATAQTDIVDKEPEAPPND